MNKKFFLISFLPALAYWYLEENYSLQVALAGGMFLALTELTLEKIFTQHIHSISKLNFFLILFLGMISFLGEDGIWFKLQPFFTGLFLGPLLIVKTYRGGSYMMEMMESMGQAMPPKEIIISLERHSGAFLLGYGCFMAFVAFKMSTEQWLFYKTAGFYIAFAFFFVIEMVLMRRQARKLYRR
jgi:intracellular septation protein